MTDVVDNEINRDRSHNFRILVALRVFAFFETAARTCDFRVVVSSSQAQILLFSASVLWLHARLKKNHVEG
jgi:hypothetical protein